MALNPIAYTEKVVRSFLRYQLTAYPFSDPRLHEQMRELLDLDHVRRTPLLRGLFISLSRSFRQGPAISELVDDGVLHPHMQQIVGRRVSHLYGHQERAITQSIWRCLYFVRGRSGPGTTSRADRPHDVPECVAGCDWPKPP